MNKSQTILPGATIGVLGSGQLGRMLAIAARQMGYRVQTFSPGSDSPTGQVADREVVGAYDDLTAIAAFAQSVDVVTFEFENVAFAATETAAQFVPVRPAGSVLHTTQNRLREKTFLQDNGFPVTPFKAIRSVADVPPDPAFPYPAILKTAGFGYDGKGQSKVANETETMTAFFKLGGQECILESLVDFACEVSVVAARGQDGAFAAYPVVRNDHANHILDVTTAPVPETDVPPALQEDARQIAQGVLDTLEVVGVLCVEFFVTKGGTLLVNELAPRPHNSGHWTIETCPTSQFEQQLRAVCNLPLGGTTPRQPAAMANLLGDLWANGEPNWPAVLALPDVHLHLYGKPTPPSASGYPGRKMGHVTALAARPDEAAARVRTARSGLEIRTPGTPGVQSFILPV